MNSTKSGAPIAAPQVISAIAAQLLSLSAKIGRPNAGANTARMFAPAQVGTMLARCTVPSGATGPETDTPTPISPAACRPFSA